MFLRSVLIFLVLACNCFAVEEAPVIKEEATLTPYVTVEVKAYRMLEMHPCNICGGYTREVMAINYSDNKLKDDITVKVDFQLGNNHNFFICDKCLDSIMSYMYKNLFEQVFKEDTNILDRVKNVKAKLKKENNEMMKTSEQTKEE